MAESSIGTGDPFDQAHGALDSQTATLTKDTAWLSLKLAPEFVRNRIGGRIGAGNDGGVAQLLPGGIQVTDLAVTFDLAESPERVRTLMHVKGVGFVCNGCLP